MSGARSPLVMLAAAGSVGAAVVLGLAFGGSAPTAAHAPLAAAVAALPDATVVAGFTNWDRILRSHTLTEARERDLVTRSTFADEPAQLRRLFGWRMRDLKWEIYGQRPEGGVAVVALNRPVPTPQRLRAHGFRRDGLVWRATGRVGAEEPIFATLGLVPRSNVVVMSEQARQVPPVLEVFAGKRPSYATRRDVAEALASVAGADSVLIQDGPLGCSATEPAYDAETAAQVKAAESRSGHVVRYRTLVRGLTDNGSDLQRFVLAMTFDSAPVASRQAGIRADLSRGPFIGLRGQMDEVLKLRTTRTAGRVAVLTYAHPWNSQSLMTGRGPLLPAAC